MEPFISIIVPTKNMERTIEKTFEYIMNIDYPRDKMEIIFADGGSRDRTIFIIKEYQRKNPCIKLIEIPNCPSPGFARTKALKEAKGEFIFFTDGDCAPVKDWIYKILDVFSINPRIGAVGGEILTLRVDPDNLVEIYCEAFGFNRVSWRYGNLTEGYFPDLSDLAPTQICGHRAYFFVTANVAYRRKTVEENNRSFWELPTGEDIDFGIRARKSGWKFYFLPSAYVEHMHRADLANLLRTWKSYGEAHPPLVKTHARRFLEIILQFIGKHPNYPIIRIPFPIKGFIYIGNFHLMHIFGLLFLLFFVLQWIWPTITFRILNWVLLLFFGYFKFKFFRSAFNIEPYDKWFEFCKMKYLTNLYFLFGGLKGFLKYKSICIEPSF